MATNDTIRVLGTPITLEANGAVTTTGSFAQADDAPLTAANVGGYEFGIFEFSSAGTFSVAPANGAAVHLYERKYMTNGTDLGPVPSASFRGDYIGTFTVEAADTIQYLRLEGVPINYHGAYYYIEWVDGNAGAATLTGGWTLVVTPYTHAPSA